MSKNPDITNDDIYTEIRADNEDSINFFHGSEIVILHKNISEIVEEDEETKKQIAGLESVIKGFSASVERVEYNKMIAGNEAFDIDSTKRQSIIKRIVNEVIDFLKRVGRWIISILTNRIARVKHSLIRLEYRRKVDGIKTREVKYPSSISALMTRSLVADSPSWVINAATVGLDFYKRSIIAHKKLTEMISSRPATKEDLKQQKTKVLEHLGRIIADGKVTPRGFATGVLPGNKIFNIDIQLTQRNGSPFYFTNQQVFVQLKTETWKPTSMIVDSGLSLLNQYVTEIQKEQKSVYSLNTIFERQINDAQKEATSWTIAYFNWLIEIHRKLISLTFNRTMRWCNALEDFIRSGINV